MGILSGSDYHGEVNHVFILAGGLGTRLRPYTTILPKPLMPIGDEAIIERIIKHVADSDASTITVSLGYMGNLLKSYLENTVTTEIEIKYTVEEQPLGTAGALAMMDSVNDDDKILIVNGDTYTDFNFKNVFLGLDESDAVIVTSRQKIAIDYGVLEVDQDGFLTNYGEKPTLDFLVSTGIYGVKGNSLKFIPSGKFDMPDLLTLISQNGKVKCIEHSGIWMDLGKPEDLIRANELFDEKI